LVTELVYSARFRRNFKKLSQDGKRAAREKLALFVGDPFHPSLRSKRIQGAPDTWESSIDMDVRMTWRWGEEEGVVELRNIGGHDKTLRNP
jgi:mRNA-degrading endonuclease YafQ of YafQ-DinJ toxin-antitoxin module